MESQNRKYRNREEWLAIFKEQKVSGLSQRSWCKASGIFFETFKSKLRVLRDQGLLEADADESNKSQSTESIRWLKVEPTKNAGRKEEENYGLQVEIGSCKVIIPECFAEAALSRVCKVLIELC